jgi:predicted mannosyl-3-phosphoglycerate phosphatase (HAD superfamily)
MPDAIAGVIFSDLDGTFLDERYRPALGADALARAAARWRVVWVSSRTADELLHLQREWNQIEDAIGENGGVCLSRSPRVAAALGDVMPLEDAWVARLASPHDDTLARVRRAFRSVELEPQTLEDLDVAELARRSGYGLDDARRAQRRHASVLLADLRAGDAAVDRALGVLRSEGCAIGVRGRWVSVVHGADKGSAALAWLDQMSRGASSRPRIVAAIGDADNDESLLAVVQHPFVIRERSSGHVPQLASVPNAQSLHRVGTEGWIEMLDVLNDFAGDLA